MKKIPLLITIPLAAVLLIVVGAMLLKSLDTNQGGSATNPTRLPNSLSQNDGSKPSTFLGGLFGNKAPTPTPSPATAADLSRELKVTYDDGGQSEMDALTREAASL